MKVGVSSNPSEEPSARNEVFLAARNTLSQFPSLAEEVEGGMDF